MARVHENAARSIERGHVPDVQVIEKEQARESRREPER